MLSSKEIRIELKKIILADKLIAYLVDNVIGEINWRHYS